MVLATLLVESDCGFGSLKSSAEAFFDIHKYIFKRGVWIGYDAVGQLDKQRDELRAQTIATLISEGYLEKILISTDIAARARLKIHGNEGYKFLITKFLPLLRSAGVTEEQIDTLTRKNPQRFLAGK